MEKEYERLKQEIAKIFQNIQVMAVAQKIMPDEKVDMNLKIIKAVVMRFIRFTMFGAGDRVLCSSVSEIMAYATTGFMRYFSKPEDRKIAFESAKVLENLVKNVEEKWSLKSA